MDTELGAALPCPRLLILRHPLFFSHRSKSVAFSGDKLLLLLLENSEGEIGLGVPCPR